MPAAPNFSESADWMTQYTYLPRTESPAACASSLRRAAAFSRTLAGALDAGAARFTARRSFVFVVFFAMNPLRSRAPASRDRLPCARRTLQLGAQFLVLRCKLIIRPRLERRPRNGHGLADGFGVFQISVD